MCVESYLAVVKFSAFVDVLADAVLEHVAGVAVAPVAVVGVHAGALPTNVGSEHALVDQWQRPVRAAESFVCVCAVERTKLAVLTPALAHVHATAAVFFAEPHRQPVSALATSAQGRVARALTCI
jgi:hypothetical protein